MSEPSSLSHSSALFSYALSTTIALIGVALSVRRRSLHPLLLACISALSISWIEAPYDWAMYAQFPPEMPRMPSWWPLNWTWGGGVPSSVPIGYMSYMVFPAIISVALCRKLAPMFHWRRPLALLTTGLLVGFLWAFINNGILGARLGVWRYGRVIEGLAVWPGTVQQYPLYDALAMGIQIMTVTYLLGRVDSAGRSVIDIWAAAKTSSRLGAALLCIAAVMVIGNGVYLSVFAPHLVTKLLHLQTVAPREQLYPGVPNQPF